MHNPLGRYIVLVKRWLWVVLVGMVISCGSTYALSKLIHPVYQASAMLVVSLDASSSSNTTSSLAAVPTYAQLLTNPVVLQPVFAQHPGLTLGKLNSVMTVKPQQNTQLIELDIQDENPRAAAQLANDIGTSFVQYANAQLPGSVQLLPAQTPLDPVKPRPLLNTEIAALVSLALAITLIIIFEWMDDHLSSPEEVRTLLNTQLLAVIPLLMPEGHGLRTRFARGKQNVTDTAALESVRASERLERYHMLCAGVVAATSSDLCKVLMITSALPGEGKSSVVTHLAVALAQTGKKVLLVDANLHRPVQAERFQIKAQQGLAQLLSRTTGMLPSDFSGIPTAQANLYLLPAGLCSTRPAQLLQSDHARALFEHFKQAAFDYVLIDAPPVLPVADAQIMASQVQAVLLVVNAHTTPRRSLVRAKYELEKADAVILGAVLNRSRWWDDTDCYTDQPDNKVKAFTPVPPPTFSPTSVRVLRASSASSIHCSRTVLSFLTGWCSLAKEQ